MEFGVTPKKKDGGPKAAVTGSVEELTRIARHRHGRSSVQQPKEYRSAMLAKDRAEHTDEQVKAVAAYVWNLSHR